MRIAMVECKRCGETAKRKREAQVYCSKVCSDAAKTQRKRQRRTQRSGDAQVNHTMSPPCLEVGDRPPPSFLRALRDHLVN